MFSIRVKVKILRIHYKPNPRQLCKIRLYLLNLCSHCFSRYFKLCFFSLFRAASVGLPPSFFFKLRCHSKRAAFFERFLITMAGCFTLVFQEGPFWLYCDFQSDFWSHFESQFWSQVVFNFGDYFACKC